MRFVGLVMHGDELQKGQLALCLALMLHVVFQQNGQAHYFADFRKGDQVKNEQTKCNKSLHESKGNQSLDNEEMQLIPRGW